jgi:hypothetical protein
MQVTFLNGARPGRAGEFFRYAAKRRQSLRAAWALSRSFQNWSNRRLEYM